MEVLSPIDPTVVSARSAAAAWRLVAPETACFVLVGGYGQLWDKLSRPFADRILLSSPVAALDWSPAGVTAHVGGGTFEGPDRRRHAAARRPPVRGGGLSTAPPGSEACGHRAACGAAPSSRWSPSSAARSGSPGPARSRASSAPDSPFFAFRVSFWDRPGPPTLVAFLGAASALAVTGYRERVAELLHQVLGRCSLRPTSGAELVRLEVADWPADPWARGAVSVEPVGGAHLRADLALPTPPLFWAGEATAHRRRRRVRARRADDRATEPCWKRCTSCGRRRSPIRRAGWSGPGIATERPAR